MTNSKLFGCRNYLDSRCATFLSDKCRMMSKCAACVLYWRNYVKSRTLQHFLNIKHVSKYIIKWPVWHLIMSDLIMSKWCQMCNISKCRAGVKMIVKVELCNSFESQTHVEMTAEWPTRKSKVKLQNVYVEIMSIGLLDIC